MEHITPNLLVMMYFSYKHLCALNFPLAVTSTESTGLEKVFLVEVHGESIILLLTGKRL